MKFYTNVDILGDNILLREYDNGVRRNLRIQYKPTLYLPSNNRETDFHTLEGRPVESVNPGGIKETRDFIRQYDGVDNFNIYGNIPYQYQFISDEYPQENIDFDASKIVVAYLDIEVGSENGFPYPDTAAEEITAITVKVADRYYTWGTQPYNNQRADVLYKFCASEDQLVLDFLDTWNKLSPDVVTGWNTKFFDIPYLVNRITRLFGDKEAKRLSPWRKYQRKIIKIMNKEETAIILSGIACMDYLELYKTFTYKNQESYRLDHIAHVELGKKKLSYEEYGSLHNLYKQDYQKFIDYNIMDVDLVSKLDDKMKLIDMGVTLAYDAKVNFADIFSQVRMWESICYNFLKRKFIVIPPKVISEKTGKYAGAFVKEPQVGMHNWVVSFDLNSLYPHLIEQFNISPETLIPGAPKSVTVDQLLNKEIDTEYLQHENTALAANGYRFDRSGDGFLPEIMNKFYSQRKVYKRNMLDAQQKLEDVKSELKRRGL